MRYKASLRAAFALLLITAITLFTRNTEAIHTVYWAEDLTSQNPNTPYTDNWVMAKWWWGQPVLWWSQASLSADAQAAITSWQNAVPQLTYATANDEQSANLVFKRELNPDPCPLNPGCFAYGPPQGNRIWERATYMIKGLIFLNDAYLWDESGQSSRRGALAHELGHAYGLDERYPESPAFQCNNNEVTIMDNVVPSGDLLFHCDGLTGPATVDIQRVVDYWSKGEASDFKIAAVDRFVVGMWKDLSWTEDSYAMGFYYLNQYNDWIMYDWRGMHDDIGVHKFTANRTLAAASDPAAFDAPIPSLQMVCNKPYFPPFNQFGTFRCSPTLWVQ